MGIFQPWAFVGPQACRCGTIFMRRVCGGCKSIVMGCPRIAPVYGHPRPVPGTRSGPSDGNGRSRGGPARARAKATAKMAVVRHPATYRGSVHSLPDRNATMGIAWSGERVFSPTPARSWQRGPLGPRFFLDSSWTSRRPKARSALPGYQLSGISHQGVGRAGL